MYRPLKSIDGEPEIVVLEIDVKTDKFVENAKPKSITGEQMIEISGGNNSLCKKVVQWLEENMGQYFNGIEVESGSSEDQVDPAHVMEKMLDILDVGKIKENFQVMNRTLADAFAKDDDDGAQRGSGH